MAIQVANQTQSLSTSMLVHLHASDQTEQDFEQISFEPFCMTIFVQAFQNNKPLSMFGCANRSGKARAENKNK